jgi:hypothetical protein
MKINSASSWFRYTHIPRCMLKHLKSRAIYDISTFGKTIRFHLQGLVPSFVGVTIPVYFAKKASEFQEFLYLYIFILNYHGLVTAVYDQG